MWEAKLDGRWIVLSDDEQQQLTALRNAGTSNGALMGAGHHGRHEMAHTHLAAPRVQWMADLRRMQMKNSATGEVMDLKYVGTDDSPSDDLPRFSAKFQQLQADKAKRDALNNAPEIELNG